MTSKIHSSTYKSTRPQSVVDPGFPWGGGANSPGGDANIWFCQIFPKNCMKLKEFGPLGGHTSKILLCRSATDNIYFIWKIFLDIYLPYIKYDCVSISATINSKVWNIQWFQMKFHWEMIMWMEARQKKFGPEESEPVCVDKWFP